jgi:hypothetical protein
MNIWSVTFASVSNRRTPQNRAVLTGHYQTPKRSHLFAPVVQNLLEAID